MSISLTSLVVSLSSMPGDRPHKMLTGLLEMRSWDPISMDKLFVR